MSESLADNILLRALRKEDIKFILYSSIKCLSRYIDTLFQGYSYEELKSHLELLFLYALKSYEKYNVFILCDQNDENEIFAYIVADREANHIVMQYTKYLFRSSPTVKLHFQKNYLLPIAIDMMKPITVNWGTKEMVKLVGEGKVSVKNLLLEDLIRSER